MAKKDLSKFSGGQQRADTMRDLMGKGQSYGASAVEEPEKDEQPLGATPPAGAKEDPAAATPPDAAMPAATAEPVSLESISARQDAQQDLLEQIAAKLGCGAAQPGAAAAMPSATAGGM